MAVVGPVPAAISALLHTELIVGGLDFVVCASCSLGVLSRYHWHIESPDVKSHLKNNEYSE